jgi:5-(carboxyamino)imidazole ribonucleotide mutase
MIQTPVVAVMMGSDSDWKGVMEECCRTLEQFEVPYEKRVLSAHRTPHAAAEFVSSGEARGIKVFIAAAGGAAHLAGVVAAHTVLPVLGVPMESASLKGMDSLLSTAQMPAGIPVGTLAIGKAGAVNAALLAIAILAVGDASLNTKLKHYRADQTAKILAKSLPDVS